MKSRLLACWLVLLGLFYSGSRVMAQSGIPLSASDPLVVALNATNLNWVVLTNFDGTVSWYAQTNESFDGTAAEGVAGEVKFTDSGPVTAGGIEVSVSGPGQLVFDWKITAQGSFCPHCPYNYGFLRLEMDGQGANVISSETTWDQQAITIPNGLHTLRWRFFHGSGPIQKVWLDRVIYPDAEPVILTQLNNRASFVGQDINLSVVAAGHDLSYQWVFNGTNIIGATNSTFFLPSARLTNAGLYSVIVSNGFGIAESSANVPLVEMAPQAMLYTTNIWVNITTDNSYYWSCNIAGSPPMSVRLLHNGTNVTFSDTFKGGTFPLATVRQYSDAGVYQLFMTNEFGVTISDPVHVHVGPVPADALETTNHTWTSVNWYNETEVTHDGIDAGVAIADTSSLETTDNGSDVLSFWFKTGEAGTLHLDIDGIEQWEETGTTNWTWKQITMPFGPKTVRFRGEGPVWVDEVLFTPAVIPPIITNQPSNQVVKLAVSSALQGPGSVEPASTVYVNAGSSQQFTAYPDEGKTVFEWRANGVRSQLGGTNFILSNIQTNYLVEAIFQPIITLYWQHINGSLGVWHMSGTNVVESTILGKVQPSWRLVGPYGNDKWVFQNPNGRIRVRTFLNTNGFRDDFAHEGLLAPSGWVLKTLLDLNGDEQPDFVFQTGNHRLAEWFMQDGTNFLGQPVLQPFNSNWRIVGAGDFNSDNQPDLLWQNLDGRVSFTSISDGTNSPAVYLRNGQRAASGWQISAVADMDYNGHPDILLVNSKRQIATWLMEGTNYLHTVLLNNGRPSAAGWKLKAAR